MGKWRVPLAFLAGIVVAVAGIRLIRAVDEFRPFGPCIYDVLREFPSPGGREVALVTRVSCGGVTNPFLTSVAIKTEDEAFDFDKRDDLFLAHSQIDIEAIWESNSALTIAYEKPYRVYRQLVVWRTMPITYREKPVKPQGGLGRSP
jgi:hypothetical protein